MLLKSGTETVQAGFNPQTLNLLRELNRAIVANRLTEARVDYFISTAGEDAGLVSDLLDWHQWAVTLCRAAQLPEQPTPDDARRAISQLLLGLLPLTSPHPAPRSLADAMAEFGAQSSSSSSDGRTSDEAHPPDEAS